MNLSEEEKLRLLQAQWEAQRELEMHREVIAGSQKQVDRLNATLGEIERKLGESYCGTSRYSHEDVRQCRASIVALIRDRRRVALRDAVDALCQFPDALVERELRNLGNNPRSRIQWNGRRGTGSYYHWVGEVAA